MKRATLMIYLINTLLLLVSFTTILAANIQYTYDNLNRLIKVDYGDGKIIEYGYDDVGNRIAQDVTVPEPVYKVTGGAYNFPDGGTYKATFSMDVAAIFAPSGWLKYSYARTRMSFVSTAIQTASVSGNQAVISGAGTVNGVSGYTFSATVYDGSPDSFGITIMKSNGTVYYQRGSVPVSGGDLSITSE